MGFLDTDRKQKLNYFKEPIYDEDEFEISQGFRQTIVLVALLAAGVTFFAVYNALQTSLVSEEVLNPSFAKYESLVKEFGGINVQCECQNTDVPVQTFATITARQDPLCSFATRAAPLCGGDPVCSSENYPMWDSLNFTRDMCDIARLVMETEISSVHTEDIDSTYLVDMPKLNGQMRQKKNSAFRTMQSSFSTPLRMAITLSRTNNPLFHELLTMKENGTDLQFQAFDECDCSKDTTCSRPMNVTLAGSHRFTYVQYCSMFETVQHLPVSLFSSEHFENSISIPKFGTAAGEENGSSFSSIGDMTRSATTQASMWSVEVSFPQYFDQCAPTTCEYLVYRHPTFLEVTTLVLGVYGGFVLVLEYLVPLLYHWALRLACCGNGMRRRDERAAREKPAARASGTQAVNGADDESDDDAQPARVHVVEKL